MLTDTQLTYWLRIWYQEDGATILDSLEPDPVRDKDIAELRRLWRLVPPGKRPMQITEFRVADVKAVDDGSTRGVIMLCTENPAVDFKVVTLVFRGAMPRQMDELAALLLKLKLMGIAVQLGR
jgi:hypothetical protein